MSRADGAGMGPLAYEVSERGYMVRAWYGANPGSPARIEITKGDELIRLFEYESYRIWNIAAHFPEIVRDLENS
jgi:hypothetical protein